ncbi:putative translation initiation factor IF-2 [Iris pallida]|uniref:Translation initiation factor IF-2 n=1 Tax=Iris pallida TaxID=29817 RepID=A0AAX6FSJ1_IRIPA|nr:putative translation initiation factor IF-2 [Iris pallida]
MSLKGDAGLETVARYSRWPHKLRRANSVVEEVARDSKSQLRLRWTARLGGSGEGMGRGRVGALDPVVGAAEPVKIGPTVTATARVRWQLVI